MKPEANLYMTQSNDTGHQFKKNEGSLVSLGVQVIILGRSDVDKQPLL